MKVFVMPQVITMSDDDVQGLILEAATTCASCSFHVFN